MPRFDIQGPVSGRTERVNARDLLNRADGILFEGDAVRLWIQQLSKRAKGTLDAAKKNKVIDKENKTDREELSKAFKALTAAYEQLEIFTEAINRREGK